MISGNDQNLGNKAAPFSTTYSVSEPDGDSITIVEKLNGSTIRTINNAVSGQTYEIALSIDQWASLPLNQASTITIEATDNKGLKTTRTYTFTKTNTAPTAVIVEPKGDLANIAIVNTITPVLVFQFQDSDAGDQQSAYEVVIQDTNGNQVHTTGKVASTQSFFQVPSGKLTWGTRYKWKVRLWDKFDVASAYTLEQFFMPNRPPNVTDVQPGSSDPNSPTGSSVTPEITWAFSDLDLEAQAAYQVRVFKKADDSIAYDSNKINKNLTKHEIPIGVLQEGTEYYAVVTVWDTNNLSKQSEKAYFRTNATPAAPTATFPINTYRTGLKPTFGAVIGTDPENNAQHFVIEIAEDVNFTQGVLSFSSAEKREGWQVNDGNNTYFDIPIGGVNNSYQGRTIRYKSQVDLQEGKAYYWRMAAIDTSTGARGKWSVPRSIRCGNTLLFTLKRPISTGTVAARRILIALDYLLPTDGAIPADFTIEVSNNALDIEPVWEDATEQFLEADFYNFTNSIKTAENFALNIRVTFRANDSLMPIELRGLGFSFD
ncbi:hypothetical protein [Bacillus sp. CGMCC 1.16541]|uniref:glycoside hydrolase family 78 protein n=1 Tax=Bacillus sp. CGMCC 1.16541 TaxID=2185143 RepID=UPI0013A5B3CC|nr:hypothetical protein [Bacillus sp. CGMCC 1.16541]